MNHWKELDIENKITEILRDIPDTVKNHHLGRPFLTAYQIAIEFAKRHPEEAARIHFPVGGAGTGQRNSLAQNIAGQLSRRIRDEQIQHIEGGFLSNQHLNDISFRMEGNEEPIHSSLTESGFTLSLFRLRD